MATGIQGQTALSAAAWSAVYTVPAAIQWTGQVNVCNRGTTVSLVRLAYSTGASPSNGEYVEYNYPLQPAGSPGNVLSRTGEVLQAGMKVFAYSDVADVDVTVSGYEV